MTKRTIGLNILGDRGRSEDEIIGMVNRLQARYHVVMNNPGLAAKIQAAGRGDVIYRNHDNDDNAQNRTDPVAFVRVRHAEAPPGALLYLGNEPYATQRLADWTLAALKECTRIGRIGVFFNFSVGNPEPYHWPMFDQVMEYAFQYKHVLGLHEYFNLNYVNDVPYYVHRWRVVRNRYGARTPEIAITEFGHCNRSGNAWRPQEGYRMSSLTSQGYGEQVVGATHEYADDGISACLFASSGDGDDWFSFHPDNTVMEYLATHPVDISPLPPEVMTPGEVKFVAQTHVNIRENPTTASRVVDTLVLGDLIPFISGRTLVIGSYEWYRVEGGWVARKNVSSGFLICDIQPAALNLPAVMLDVPYVSQSGDDANIRQNDCGIACALMVYQFALQEAGFKPNTTLTVDSLIEKSPLAGNDNPVGITQLTAFCNALGIEARYQRPLDGDGIVRLIDQGVAPILLVRYKYIYPDTFTGGHYVVAVGYNEDGVFVHDPYRGGEAHFVSFPDLALAMTDMGEAAALDYQGIVAGHPSKLLALQIDG